MPCNLSIRITFKAIITLLDPREGGRAVPINNLEYPRRYYQPIIMWRDSPYIVKMFFHGILLPGGSIECLVKPIVSKNLEHIEDGDTFCIREALADRKTYKVGDGHVVWTCKSLH